MSETGLFLVFTDLDGSLLDHHTYGWEEAQPTLDILERLAIPVIPATSKTRVEIEELRARLGIGGPFIVENGAAVFIPQPGFPQQPAGTLAQDGYWVHELSPPRQRWLQLLADLAVEFDGEFEYFFRAGPAGIARMTGLPPAQAALANRREYSEPVQWLGSPGRKQLFMGRLRERGATVLQGGRFLSVSGNCDKGRALGWLRDVYRRRQPDLPCHDLAVGDSPNDCAMLEAAETALLVRSPAHPFPPLRRREGVIRSAAPGPAGWAEGVEQWLQGYRLHR